MASVPPASTPSMDLRLGNPTCTLDLLLSPAGSGFSLPIRFWEIRAGIFGDLLLILIPK